MNMQNTVFILVLLLIVALFSSHPLRVLTFDLSRTGAGALLEGVCTSLPLRCPQEHLSLPASPPKGQPYVSR